MKRKAVSRIMLTLLFISTLTLAFNTTPVRSGIKVSDDFNDNSINSDLWSEGQSGGVTVNEINQRLEIFFPWDSAGAIFGAGYWSKCLLRGDFDIQADFSLLDWPSVDQLGTGNGVRIGLAVGEGENAWSVQRTSFGTADLPSYPPEVYLCDFAGSVQGITSTNDMSGKLRLVRSGNTLTGYYFSSGSWVTVASGWVTTGDVWFGNNAWSHDDVFMDNSVLLAFDNFVVNSGRIAPAPVGEAKGQEFPPAFLKGNRISLVSSNYIAVPAGQPCFVIHGWQNPNWMDYSGQERKSLLRDYSFVLEIDGLAVELRRSIHYYITHGPYEDVMLVTFYVQFEANQFAVGTYTFRGVWYRPDMTVEYERVVPVEFY